MRTSELAALEIERIITGADGILRTVALAPSVRFLTTNCDAYLGEVAARLPQLRGFVVADPDGHGALRRPASASGRRASPVSPGSGRRSTAPRFVVGEYTLHAGGGRLPAGGRLDRRTRATPAW